MCLVNNYVGREVLGHLVEQDEDIVCVCVHPPGNAKWYDSIVKAATRAGIPVMQWDRMHIDQICSFEPELILSVFWGYILRKEILEIPRLGCINLHPAYLPWGRGSCPNTWAIHNKTDAGATLHYMDEGIDTGDVIAQKRVEVLSTDTGESLYGKLEFACAELFMETWPSIREGKSIGVPQIAVIYDTPHTKAQFEEARRIDPEQWYLAWDLIDKIRAFTFPPYKGAYLDYGDRRVYLRLQLEEEQCPSKK